MQDYTNTTLHFRKIKDIGAEGKNSSVFTAHDIQLDSEIVVKKIKKSDFKTQESFFNEAKILYMSQHPNIAPIQYSCQDDEHIYITMPLFNKGSLNSIIDSRFLSISEIIKYSIDLLCGLHHIHTKKLIHSDIKPSNILLSNSYDAVLCDFGLAKHLSSDGVAELDRFYHFHIAPESIESKLLSHKSDIYQAGLTIYRLCNGNAYYRNQLSKIAQPDISLTQAKLQAAILSGKFPDRSSYLLHIPQKLRNYIRKALEPNPEKRYDSVLEFLNDLAGVETPYDWAMTKTSDSLTWKCNKEEKEYCVSIFHTANNSASVKTTKKTLNNPDPRSISSYCKNNLTFDGVNALAKKALHDSKL